MHHLLVFQRYLFITAAIYHMVSKRNRHTHNKEKCDCKMKHVKGFLP